MKTLSLAIALVLNATQGHAEAAYNADFVHELRSLGRGHKAFQYALTWAGSGDADAELEVIYSLLDGKGIEPDPLAAMAFACGPRQVDQFNIEKVLTTGNLRLSGTGTAVVRCKGSAGPWHLLIDSTGIKAEGEGEWNARKHGGPKRRLWRKIHIGIDEQALEIRAIEVTSSSIGDAPILPDLLNQILPGQELGSVTADGAYDTRKCHDAIAARNAHAVVPPRKNAKLWKPDTPGPEHAMKPCAPQSIWDAHCGDS